MESPIAGSPEAEYRAKAVARASRAARSYLLSSTAFHASLGDVVVSTERYSRALHSLERRTVQLRTRPAPQRRSGALSSPPSPAIDPWSVDPTTISAQTRVTCTCPHCRGSTRVTCPSCRGTERVACHGCGGAGRVPGRRGFKNCPSCRGTGQRKCTDCRTGTVGCRPCDERGALEAWLEILQEPLHCVTTAGSATARAVHFQLDRPENFDALGTFPSHVVSDDSVGPEAVPSELAPPCDPVTDRARGARIQVFETFTARVPLRLTFGTAAFHIAGDPPGVGRVDSGPLLARIGVAAAAAVGLALASAEVVHAYASRHPWFAQQSAAAWIGLALTFATAAMAFVVLRLGEGGARRAARSLVPLGGAALAGVAALALFVGANPSAAHAAELAQRGELERAALEADAARDYGADRAGAEALLDFIHRQELDAATTLAEATTIAGGRWFDPAHEAEARAEADRRHLEALRAAGDFLAMEPFVALPWFDPTARAQAATIQRNAVSEAVAAVAGDEVALRALRPHVVRLAADLVPSLDQQLALLAIEACRAGHNWPCLADRIADARAAGAPEAEWDAARREAATSLRHTGASALAEARRTHDHVAQSVHLHEALEAAQLLERLGAPETTLDPASLSTRVADADAVVARDAERAQRAAEARRAREQQAIERAQARQRARSYGYGSGSGGGSGGSGGCRCCDGASGCCGRGCCSHHGGIC